MLGFNCSNGDVSRLNARYRLTKEYKGIMLENYEVRTKNGYEALFKAFLAWSVCERYHAIAKKGKSFPINFIESLFNREELTELLRNLQKIDKGQSLSEFIRINSEEFYQKEIDKYLASEDFHPLALLASLRNVFVHGHLAASVNETPSSKIIQMCNLLFNAVLDVIARDFERRVKENLR